MALTKTTYHGSFLRARVGQTSPSTTVAVIDNLASGVANRTGSWFIYGMRALLKVSMALLILLGRVAIGAEARSQAEFDGISFEYPAKYEALAKKLSPHLVRLNQENADRRQQSQPTSPGPLRLADLRERRIEYLTHVAAAIGLTEPTPLQVECYDAFLENFETSAALIARLAAAVREHTTVQSVMIWEKEDLLTRLKGGEAIPGFSLDPTGSRVNFNWSFQISGADAELARLADAREKRRLDYSYNITIKDDIASISGGFRPKREPAEAQQARQGVNAPQGTGASSPMRVPLVILPEDSRLPLDDLAAEKLKALQELSRFANAAWLPSEDAAPLFYLLLHETAEVGIVERYLGSKDRRWLCDGTANYVAWKVVRDLVGPEASQRVYNLDAQLSEYVSLKPEVDLQRWPAVEHQRIADANSPLNKAHYAYATRAVFLLVEKHGNAFLPQLFREIGRFPRAKTSMKTVEKIYRNLTNERLPPLLLEATK